MALFASPFFSKSGFFAGGVNVMGSNVLRLAPEPPELYASEVHCLKSASQTYYLVYMLLFGSLPQPLERMSSTADPQEDFVANSIVGGAFALMFIDGPHDQKGGGQLAFRGRKP